MAYEKRICILKQIKKGFSADGNRLTGVVYAEKMGEELLLTLRMPGLSALKEGRYVLVVQIGGKKYCFAADEPMKLYDVSVKEGFAALLCFLRTEAEPIAFGWCGSEQAEAPALLKALSETGRKRSIPTPMPPNQIPAAPAPNIPFAPGVPLPDDPPSEEEKSPPFREQAAAYDDEAIAESDYYEPSHADEVADGEVPKETEETAGGGDPSAHEDALLTRGTLTYYREVRDEIEEVLKKYPPDTRLKWAFPHSEWARNGDSLIGIVYEAGIPRYLCVAAETLQPSLKEQSVFVPASPFSDERGFYVVFQDADTGAYVKVESL